MAGWNLETCLLQRPYAAASLGCHAVLLAALAGISHFQAGRAAQADIALRAQASLERARAAEQARVAELAAIQSELEQTSGQPAAARPAPNAPLLERAKASADAIRRLDQQARARQLAELLGIPADEALKRVRADDARQATPPSTLAQLEQQAQAALARSRRHDEGRRNGVPLHQAPGQWSGVAGGGESGGATVMLRGGNPALSSSNNDGRSYEGYLSPPAIAPASLRTGAGRIFGAGGQYANRVALDSWYLIGPFPGHGEASLDTVYPPEQTVDLDGLYLGKGQRPLTWAYVPAAGYPVVPPDAAESAVYYAYTEVRTDREREVWLAIGADDDVKVWLNGEEIWRGGNQDKPWYHTHFRNLGTEVAQLNLTEGSRRVHFKQGRNTVLVKLYNGAAATFFSLVVVN